MWFAIKNSDDVVQTDALLQQIIPVERAQQIGLSAPPNPGDDLDLAVPGIGFDLLQIGIALDFHGLNLH